MITSAVGVIVGVTVGVGVAVAVAVWVAVALAVAPPVAVTVAVAVAVAAALAVAVAVAVAVVVTVEGDGLADELEPPHPTSPRPKATSEIPRILIRSQFRCICMPRHQTIRQIRRGMRYLDREAFCRGQRAQIILETTDPHVGARADSNRCTLSITERTFQVLR